MSHETSRSIRDKKRQNGFYQPILQASEYPKRERAKHFFVFQLYKTIPYSSLKYVFSFDGDNYETVEDSKYNHEQTYGLGIYHGKAFTTGCAVNGCTSYVATELLDMTTMKWSDGPDYPFAPSG